jgi:hypothetical protein
MFGTSYLDMFAATRMWSEDLKNPGVYDLWVRHKGFVWIRPVYDRHFSQIVRNPTIGRNVELFKIQHLGCVPIDSPEGRKIINKICYYHR